MLSKRLALGTLVATLAVTAFGGIESSSGQSSGPAGVTYGGVRDFEWVWLRLDSTRDVVMALEIPWATSGKRCSDGRPYTSVLYAGADYQGPVEVRADGKFGATVVDRYRLGRTRYVETQIVKGTFTDTEATGTIQGTVKQTKRNGRVVRCTFGPLRWSAVN